MGIKKVRTVGVLYVFHTDEKDTVCFWGPVLTPDIYCCAFFVNETPS